MCDCVSSSTLLSFSVIKLPRLSLITYHFKLLSSSSRSHYSSITRNGSLITKATRNPGPEYEFDDEFGFKDKSSQQHFEFGEASTTTNDKGIGSRAFDVLEFGDNKKRNLQSGNRLEEEDLVAVEDSSSKIIDDSRQILKERTGLRTGKQVIRRSNMLAKQVISIQSARGLGFVSQLWVDTTSWMVLVIEVRPNLLSGESERFLLQDVSQVGDVVLVEDESVIENELKMVGFETLVGYKVMTPGQQTIGKVRGYSFNIASGAVESLELDSFGISIIPSSLVSTYLLLVEDVLEVLSDTIIVHEAAVSRIQRLTKGFWDAQNMRTSSNENGEYDDFKSWIRSDHGGRFGKQKFHPKTKETEDDWEDPMDYL